MLRYIPNDTLKWLKDSRFYGSIDGIFDEKILGYGLLQMTMDLNGAKPVNIGG